VVAGQVIVDDAMVLARTEEDQLELAVRQNAQLVYRIAYSVLRNHHDAEDSTQETFVRVLRAKTKLNRVDDPQSWLARIAWRVAVERKKKIATIPFDDRDQFQSGDTAADEVVLGREVATALERLIPALPDSLRDVVTLSTLEEMSPSRVASTLDISEAAVRSRLSRGRQILKERLGKLLEGRHGTR